MQYENYILSFKRFIIKYFVSNSFKSTSMLKQHSIQKQLLSFFILIAVVSACTNNGSEKKMASKQESAVALTGFLDTLWTYSTTFNNLPKGKIVFSFSFWLPDSITLHGWDARGAKEDSFKTDPAIKLFKGRPTAEVYRGGTYFGNEILNGKDNETIKRWIDSLKTPYLLFIPEKDGEHIKYTIRPTKKYPLTGAASDKAEYILTAISTNPSPPRQY